MKKLIKSGIYEIYKQCIYTRFTKNRSTIAAEEKKKKEGENADAARLSAIQAYTTRTFSILSNDKCNY